jgi:hypothetical protein
LGTFHVFDVVVLNRFISQLDAPRHLQVAIGVFGQLSPPVGLHPVNERRELANDVVPVSFVKSYPVLPALQVSCFQPNLIEDDVGVEDSRVVRHRRVASLPLPVDASFSLSALLS